MRTLAALGLGALAMYLFTRAKTTARRRAVGLVRSELEPDRSSETPPGAQHLGR